MILFGPRARRADARSVSEHHRCDRSRSRAHGGPRRLRARDPRRGPFRLGAWSERLLADRIEDRALGEGARRDAYQSPVSAHAHAHARAWTGASGLLVLAGAPLKLLEMLAVPVSKPRLRGVSHQWACLCSVPLGVVLLVAAGSERARIAETVYAVTLVALFWGERSVSPGRLAVAGRVAVDAPAGPFNDLHADRGHLHAACPARSPRAVGHRDPDRGVGGGAGRRRVQARVYRRADVAVRGRLYRGWAGSRSRPSLSSRGRDRCRRLDAARARRRALHGGCRRLCGEAPGPGARGVRIPRGVPRPGHRCGRGPVRGDRVLGRAPLRTQPNREPARDAPARIHPPSVTLTTPAGRLSRVLVTFLRSGSHKRPR